MLLMQIEGRELTDREIPLFKLSGTKKWGPDYDPLVLSTNTTLRALYGMNVVSHYLCQDIPKELPDSYILMRLHGRVQKDSDIISQLREQSEEVLQGSTRQKDTIDDINRTVRNIEKRNIRQVAPPKVVVDVHLDNPSEILEVRSKIASIDHDLKTPITALIGYQQLLEQALKKGDQVYLGRIYSWWQKVLRDLPTGLLLFDERLLDKQLPQFTSLNFYHDDLATWLRKTLQQGAFRDLSDKELQEAIIIGELPEALKNLTLSGSRAFWDWLGVNMASNINDSFLRRAKSQPHRKDPRQVRIDYSYDQDFRGWVQTIKDTGEGVIQSIDQSGRVIEGVSANKGKNRGKGTSDVLKALEKLDGTMTIHNRDDGATGAEVTVYLPTPQRVK